jgi:carbamoyl-phosphate synthase small subunit
VRDVRNGRVCVTSQNHGYAVDPETLPPQVQPTHVSLNDSTLEGFVLDRDRLMAVQYHPESSPGPHDSLGLFREFHALAGGRQAPAGRALEGEP